MASTRNRNSKHNYSIEQRMFNQHHSYNVSSDFGKNNQTFLPDFGINPAQLPRQSINHNSVNVESDLFGIGVTNLVEEKDRIIPIDNNMSNIAFFERPELQMPEPLVVEKNQRVRVFH